MNKPDADNDILHLLERDDTRTSARHDDAVLAAARSMADSARQSDTQVSRDAGFRRRWKVPAALAASFGVGALLGVVFGQIDGADVPAPDTTLMLPLDAVRGGAGRVIAVEQAAPEDWYRYIQELIVAGQTQEAERHLHRFNELHPNYAHEP
jgi:hypothetical protein